MRVGRVDVGLPDHGQGGGKIDPGKACARAGDRDRLVAVFVVAEMLPHAVPGVGRDQPAGLVVGVDLLRSAADRRGGDLAIGIVAGDARLAGDEGRSRLGCDRLVGRAAEQVTIMARRSSEATAHYRFRAGSKKRGCSRCVAISTMSKTI